MYGEKTDQDFVPLNQMGVIAESNPQKRMTHLTVEDATALSEGLADEMIDYYRSLVGWRPISGMWDYQENELDEKQQAREFYVRRSRQLARREPLSKQAVRLYTTYSGILKVEFKSKSKRAEKIWNTRFWKLPTNRSILKPINRRKLSLRLLTDGELFLPLFPFNNGEVVIRYIDSLQFPEDSLLTHPEDIDTVLFYKRNVPTDTNKDTKRVQPTRGGGQIKGNFRYYRAIDATDEILANAVSVGFEMPPTEAIEKTSEGNEVLMYHAVFDSMGQRGNGILFAVISYVENFRDFLQNRATIVRGLSTYIREITMKGGSKAVSDFASRFRSSLGIDNFVDNNPPDAAGSTWFQNEQTSAKDTPPITGAGDARSDSRIFRQPIAAGVGITEANLTGDPSIGNLASQEQMEGPQLQNFQDYQFLWEELFRDLWEFVQEHNGAPVEKIPPLDVDMPPIIRHPLSVLWTVLQGAQQAGYVPFDEAARQVLMALGANDIDALIETAKEEKEERQEKAMQIQQGKPGEPQKGDEDEAARDEADEESKQAAVEEHDAIAIEGECPFCGEDGKLKTAHDVFYCSAPKCGVSFHPSYYGMDKLQEDLQELMGRT